MRGDVPGIELPDRFSWALIHLGLQDVHRTFDSPEDRATEHDCGVSGRPFSHTDPGAHLHVPVGGAEGLPKEVDGTVSAVVAVQAHDSRLASPQ